MNSRPKILEWSVYALVAVTLSFPVQIAWLYGHPLWEFQAILSKISLANAMVMAALLANIPLLLKASRALLFTLPLTTVLVTWNNAIVSAVGNDFSLTQTLFASAAFGLAANGLFFHPHVSRLIANPRLRWWLRSPRKKAHTPIYVDFIQGPQFEAELFDLSKTGAFIHLEQDLHSFSHLKTGDLINLQLSLTSLKPLRCQAEVIRQREDSHGSYPGGIGVRFKGLNKWERKNLDHYFESLSPPV